MNDGYISATYRFTLGNVTFVAEVDYTHIDTEATKNDIGAPLGYHPMHEICFSFEDSLTILTADTEHTFTHSIVAVPPLLAHRSLGDNRYRIIFSFTADSEASKSSDIYEVFNREFTKREISRIAFAKPEMKVYLDELIYLVAVHRDAPLCHELTVAVLKLIFYHVYLYSRHTDEHAQTPKESYYLIINRLLECPPANAPSLKEIAGELHLSEKQASRIIKKYYGMPLSRLIFERKLSYAAQLLTATDMRVAEISAAAGFHSPSYFYRSFLSHYGLTPIKYRKSLSHK